MNWCRLPIVAFALLAAFLSPRAQGGLIISAVETNSSVVFSYSGSVDLTGAPTPGTTSPGSFLNPGLPAMAFGGTGGQVSTYSLGSKSWDPFGSGGVSHPSSHSGDAMTIGGSTLSRYMDLPLGYISGAPISGTMTFNGASLAGLGVTPGTYVYDLTFSGAGAVPQSATLTVVPEPGVLALLALFGIARLAQVRRRKWA